MRARPSERFLGVPPDAGPRELLGVAGDVVLQKLTIERALRARLTMVDRHPGSQSPDAELVRQQLRRAADALQSEIGMAPITEPPKLESHKKAQKARTAFESGRSHAAGESSRGLPVSSAHVRGRSRPGIALTEFDRQVLGTLVGSGGWNRASRARLVAIAAVHRVTVHGLLTVIRRLNDYARSGGARLDVATITAGRRSLVPASVDLPRRQTVSLAERLLPELKEPTPATTVKWSFIFGLLAVVLGGGLILIVLANRDQPIATPPIDEGAPPVIAHADTSNGQAIEQEVIRAPATFAQPPTFDLSIDHLAPAELLAQAVNLPEEFDHVARRVRVADEPAESTYRDWSALLDVAARTWVVLDEPLDRQTVAAVRKVFEEASTKPGVSDRLLGDLGVGASMLTKPEDIWSSTWRIERLAEIAQSLRLSPAVRERAELMLAAALTKGADTRVLTPPEIAAAWLVNVADWLAEGTEASPTPYQGWAAWLVAVDRIAPGERRNALLADAVETILSSGVDLSREGPSVNVLGRLLEEMDWRDSAIIKQHVASWFDEESHGVTGDDLWVATSIIATRGFAPWFAESFIVPRGADLAHRRRVRDQIVSAWPARDSGASEFAGPAGRGIDVDPNLARRWRTLQSTLLSTTPMTQPLASTQHIALLARLNAAASLLERGDATNAAHALDWIERAMTSAAAGGGRVSATAPQGPFSVRQGSRTPGQPIGQDGVWAAAYAQAGSGAEGRINLLRALRSTAGTDLGPTDAAVFVREAYRATPVEVRDMAQAVAMMFTDGPNVSLQLLDQLPDAIANEDTSEFLQRFMGRHLPPARSAQWAMEARQKMLSHCLSLMASTEREIDRAAQFIADAVSQQGPNEAGGVGQQIADSSPSQVAELVRQAWADAMRGVVAAEPVPGDIEFIERRHRTRTQLSSGPIQSYVASRIGHLEVFAFAVTAEQPALRVTVVNLLADSTAARAKAQDALHQAIEVERTFSKLHALRMRSPSGESAGATPGRGGQP